MTDEAARLICSAEFGKEWDDSTDQERQQSIAMAEEMQEIINAPWPAHPSERGLH